MNDPKLPPCAEWKLWTGNEIEGFSALGSKTLFVREASAEQIFAALNFGGFTDIYRVWFCKEFVANSSPAHLKLICSKLKSVGLPLAFEIRIDHLHYFQDLVRPFGTIYVKIPDLQLALGDHVCVGPAFEDESFMIGNGAKVSPEAYKDDINLLP